MASNATTADVAPEKITQATSSEDDVVDPDDTNSSGSHADMNVLGGMTSDVTSDEYSSRISVLSEQLKSLRAATQLRCRIERMQKTKRHCISRDLTQKCAILIQRRKRYVRCRAEEMNSIAR